MAETMIERVARSICKSQTQTDRTWEAFLPEAMAAIEAMREPPESYMKQYPAYRIKSDWYPPNEVRGLIWQQMIDAALSEGEGR